MPYIGSLKVTSIVFSVVTSPGLGEMETISGGTNSCSFAVNRTSSKASLLRAFSSMIAKAFQPSSTMLPRLWIDVLCHWIGSRLLLAA